MSYLRFAIGALCCHLATMTLAGDGHLQFTQTGTGSFWHSAAADVSGDGRGFVGVFQSKGKVLGRSHSEFRGDTDFVGSPCFFDDGTPGLLSVFNSFTAVDRGKNGDQIYRVLNTGSSSISCFDVVGGRSAFEITADVVGGTGRFENATGTIVVSGEGSFFTFPVNGTTGHNGFEIKLVGNLYGVKNGSSDEDSDSD